MNQPRPRVLVIAGQTGSGKSALAANVCARLPAEIVSADSVQVYRGFDIGSAKPTAQEREAAPHHLIDILNPDESIDAADYARRADEAIGSIAARDRLPVIVGGTGLWLRALLMGLVELPKVDIELRERLQQEAARSGSAAMHSRLEAIDPIAAQQIHQNDVLRIVRALEVFEQTGTPLGVLREKHALGEPRYLFKMIVLEQEADVLRPRLLARAQSMLAAGWIEEVRSLLQKWKSDARPFGSVGYREVCEHLRGDLPRDALADAIEKETWRYAKRQRNWFRAERYAHCRSTPSEAEVVLAPMLRELVA